MSQSRVQHVVDRLRKTAEFGEASDSVLLGSFIGERCESAFAEIVRRHGPMVWGVCWRLLSSRQDAEDCYQATFLVLVRKAGMVRPRSRVGAWLHGVAYHTALKARHLAAKRGQMEHQVDRLPDPISNPAPAAELRQLIDRALHELPDKYRTAIVLCELEGRTIKDVAEQLGSPIGTVAGWLARGRDLLARRLIKHGLSAVAIAAILAEKSSAAGPELSASTASSSVLVLANATIRTFYLATLKSGLIATAAVIALTFSVGWIYHAVAGNNAEVLPAIVGPLVPPDRANGGRPVDQPPVFVNGKNKDANQMITKDTQKIIDAGLAYLAKEQAKDGSWGAGNFEGDIAITSLAGLAFLSSNHHSDRGDYGKVVTKAVRYVLSREDKDTPGFLKGPVTHGPMYGHGFAVLFLADAHGTISDKKLKTEVKEALTRSVKLIIDSQNNDGGWRYQPKPQDADVSVTACQVAALRAARDTGIDVPKEAMDKAVAYVKSCQNADDGGFRYQPFGGPSAFARSAAGLTSLNRLGVKDGEVVEKATKYLHKVDLKSEAVQINYFYGHYYAAKAMWFAGDKDWQKWYPAIRDDLLGNCKEGHHWSQGILPDPHYCTSMSLIILQMPHGRLASMKR